MVKHLRSYLFAACMAMIAGAQAQNQTDVLTWEYLGLDGAVTNYQTFSKTSETTGVTYSGSLASNKGTALQFRGSKNTDGLVCAAPEGTHLVSVKFNYVTVDINGKSSTNRNVNVYGNSTAYADAAALYAAATQGTQLGTVTDAARELTIGGTYRYVGFNNVGGATYFSSVELTWGKGEAKQPVTITFAQSSYNLAAGSEEFNAFRGQTATVTPEGLALTYTSDQSWATVTQDGTVTLDNAAAGTATITAAFAGNDTYAPATASYTINVMAVCENIAAAKALPSDTRMTLKLKDAEVLYVNGTNDMYIRDASGAIDLFRSGLNFKAGQVLNGTITGTFKSYFDLPEVLDITDNTLTATDGSVIPNEFTTAKLSENNYCDLVKVTAQYTATGNMLDGTIQIYDKFKTALLDDFTDGTYYTVTGIYVAPYKGTKQLYIVSYENVATKVTSVEQANADAPRYNLAGQRVDSGYKGIYIQNGKKYVK